MFYSSLGHVAKEFDVPEMRTILRRGMVLGRALNIRQLGPVGKQSRPKQPDRSGSMTS